MRVERLRRALRAVRDYIRYDLREIVAPSSLPDPPGVKHKRLTLGQYWQVRHSVAAASLFTIEESARMQRSMCIKQTSHAGGKTSDTRVQEYVEAGQEDRA